MKADNLVSLLEEGASLASTRQAVRGGHTPLGWDELQNGARGIGAGLRAVGIGRGDRVGIWMDKSPRCVQAIFGVLMSGAAYVPLDPRAPWRRCRAIALDCGFAALIVDAPRLPVLEAFLEGQTPRLVVIDDTTNALKTIPVALPSGPTLMPFSHLVAQRSPPLPTPSPNDLAYILYTSGSTGTPKGVAHSHASAMAFVRWVQHAFRVTPDDVFSSHAPFHFDLSISDLFASLGSGAPVQLVSATEAMLAPHLVKQITAWGITVWYSVPSILVSMLDQGKLESLGLPTLRVLMFAGEVFPAAQLKRLRQAVPDAHLSNLFGPTETNVCTYWNVPKKLPADNAPIPIGRGCEHMQTFVLDDAGCEADEGTLWVRDGNVMVGYWNDPKRTDSTLKPDPRGRPGLAYCTGDRVKRRPDGDYDFLGRRDHLVKTRGFRVDLGEVESALAAHPDVLESVVIAVPDEILGNRLVGLVTPRADASLHPTALRAHCRLLLSNYMVPERVEVLPQLPRTSTGKVNRTALRAEWVRRLKEAS